MNSITQKTGKLLFFLITLISCSSQNNSWGESAERFFIPLTYSNAEWSKGGFGVAANEQEKKLLQEFLPRIFLSNGALVPLDFYEDYLPKTVLKNYKNNKVDEAISREYLKKIERNPNFYLDYIGQLKKCYQPECSQQTRSIYGRVFYEKMKPPSDYKEKDAIDFIVLKYNLVYPASGLPKKVSWYKNVGLSLLGDKENWHELDIHGAIHLFIEQKTGKLRVLLLAQHNYFRSYVIKKDINPPEDNRLNICIAIRSNEPYPCSNQTTEFRTVGNPFKFDFVLGGKAPLFDGGYDVVSGLSDSIEQKLVLKFLPDKDPLYISWIDLGDRQKIMGIFPSFFRSAPPGINMNTTPKLKKYTDIAKVWYFLENDPIQRELFANIGNFSDPNVAALLEYNGARLWATIKK